MRAYGNTTTIKYSGSILSTWYQSPVRKKIRAIFCTSSTGGHTTYDDYDIDHTHLDHGYITLDYLDININDYLYSYTSATTTVTSVRIITCVHNTPVVAEGGKTCTRRGHSHRSYVPAMIMSIRDAVDDDKEKKTTEAEDFKSSRTRPLHSRYD